MFTVTEGENETFLFRGSIYRGNTDFNEIYANGTDRVRILSTQLVSMLGALQSVTMTDLRTEILTHIETLTNGNFIQMSSIVGSIVTLAYGEPFSKTLAVNNSTDIQATLWEDYTTFVADWQDLYIWDTVNVYLYSVGDGRAWTDRFATAFDLLKHLSLHFGVVPRYSFGTADELIDPTPANNSHRITFNSRGRASASLSMPVPLESKFISDTTYKSHSIRASDTLDATRTGYVTERDKIYKENLEPLPFEKFDTDIQVDWNTSMASVYVLYYLGVDTLCHQANVRYYNYDTKAYVPIAQAEGVNNWISAIVNYLFYRFLIKKRFEYTRSYNTIMASNSTITSQRVLRTLAKHQITDIIDGASVTNDYYATEVHKNIMTNRSKIVWVQQ
jgi:hypothetical protein